MCINKINIKHLKCIHILVYIHIITIFFKIHEDDGGIFLGTTINTLEHLKLFLLG